MPKGKIKWFNEQKGCGYIEETDGQSLFFYDPKFLNDLVLTEGQFVDYDTKKHESGLFCIAINVRTS